MVGPGRPLFCPTLLVPIYRERFTEEPIVRHAVDENQCDDDSAYENSDLVRFAPRPIRAVNPKDLANQISDHAIMRQLQRSQKKAEARTYDKADLHQGVCDQGVPVLKRRTTDALVYAGYTLPHRDCQSRR
jgi:replicative DNA helicase